VKEIIRVAGAHNVKVLLTTQPYSRTDLSWSRFWVEGMTEANDSLRSIANDLGLPLVDLDGLMQGNEESFRDPVHLRSSAVDVKVQAIADILAPLLAEQGR
jgi:lysophospholipase L1-like esterase